MPELPEVEAVVRQIRPKLIGRTIQSARFAIPRQLRPQSPRVVARAVRGQTIHEVRRRGKIILIEMDKGTLLVHLRMTGRLYVRKDEKPNDPHERAWLSLDDGGDLLAFRDPRTLGVIRYYPAGTPIAAVNDAGWEPLEVVPAVNDVRALLKRRSIAIKPLLLNQSIWAGIGNIYASEILWRARVSPRKSAKRLSCAEIERLIEAVPSVLRRALEMGGSTVRDFADGEGRAGRYQREFAVYGRDDEPCSRCGRPILRIVQAQRSTYFCRHCQK